MNNITVDEVKDILKCSIDETTNMNEAIERTLQRIYLKGWNDAENLQVNEILRKIKCEDAISRQEVLDQIYNWSKDEFLRVTNPFHYLRKRIDSLPSVTPQPKMGKWIIVDDCERFIAKCSECGQIEDSRMINKYPYCHCGAKMQK